MVFGASTLRDLPDAPLTTSRCRSPMKLTLSMVPVSGAPADFDDPDRFGPDHGDRGLDARVAANRLPSTRQHKMAVLDRQLR